MRSACKVDRLIDDADPIKVQLEAELKRIEQRAARRRAVLRATVFAEGSVKSDRRMLGLPHVRWRVIDCAARHALSGLDTPPVMDMHGVHPDDREMVMEVLMRAIETVKDRLTPEFLHESQ